MQRVLLTQAAFFAKEGVGLGRAVLEAPEPFCEVLDPLIGGRSGSATFVL